MFTVLIGASGCSSTCDQAWSRLVARGKKNGIDDKSIDDYRADFHKACAKSSVNSDVKACLANAGDEEFAECMGRSGMLPAWDVK